MDEFFINFYLLYSWYPTKNRIYNQTEDPTLDLRQKAKKQSNTQDPKKWFSITESTGETEEAIWQQERLLWQEGEIMVN